MLAAYSDQVRLVYLWGRHLAFVSLSYVHRLTYLTIAHSGGALERGFKRVINDAPVGSLLIQSDSTSGEALLLQVMLPQYVRLRHLAKQAYVFLLDAQVRALFAIHISNC